MLHLYANYCANSQIKACFKKETNEDNLEVQLLADLPREPVLGIRPSQ